MSNEPGALWPVEYAADQAEVRRQKEQLRVDFAFQSPQVQYRSYLVSWMRLKAEKFKFNICTLHLAIYVMDVFMDNHNIEKERLHIVALICLWIASKYEEYDVRIPRLSHLNKEVANLYKVNDFLDLEVLVLSFLDWDLNLPTAAHFSEYYSLFAVTRRDWNEKENVESYENFWQEARRVVNNYLDLSLNDINMVHYLPSAIASACILLARQQLQLAPVWTFELEEVTKYIRTDLTECANDILSCQTPLDKANRKRKCAESPDLGYDTAVCSPNTPDGNSAKRCNISASYD